MLTMVTVAAYTAGNTMTTTRGETLDCTLYDESPKRGNGVTSRSPSILS